MVKEVFLIVLAALCAGCGHGAEREKPAFVAAANGVLQADIVIPAKPKGVERYAADELKYHLDRAFGTKAEIVSEDSYNPSNCPYHFFIGATRAAAAAGLSERPFEGDEHLLRTVGNGLYMLGGDSNVSYGTIGSTWCVMRLGTLYAVYDFLEREMGVLWIWPGETGEVIPKRRRLALPKIDRRGSEPLAERYWHGTASWGPKYGFTSKKALDLFYARQSKFLVRHRVGRRVNTRSGHSFADWWKRFGKEHPEYFNLLSDGQRRPFNDPSLVTMCCSEPGVWKQKALDFKEWWKKTGKPGGYEPWVNCCENDNAGLCQCARCRAWDAPDSRFGQCPYWKGDFDHEALEKLSRTKGGWGLSLIVGDNRWDIPKEDSNAKPTAPLSDRYAKFYNHILAEVRKSNPLARAIGYAYENYIEAPRQTKVDPGVVIEFVPRSYFPYDRAESDFFRKHWMGWKNAGVKDFVLRPNYMLAGGNYPFDQGRLILDDFAFAYTNGMMSCSFDSLRGSWSAHALMDYAVVRAFRDPLHGYDRAREEMLSAFGPAREEVSRYFDAVRRHTEKWTFAEVRKMAAENFCGGQTGGSFGNGGAILGEFFDDSFFRDNNRLLDRAVAAAAGDAEVVARIEFLRKGLRDAELTRKVRLAQKAWLADKGDAAKTAAFDAAFKEMNDYRATVEGDCVCNFSHEARRERTGLGWPQQKLEPEK